MPLFVFNKKAIGIKPIAKIKRSIILRSIASWLLAVLKKLVFHWVLGINYATTTQLEPMLNLKKENL